MLTMAPCHFNDLPIFKNAGYILTRHDYSLDHSVMTQPIFLFFPVWLNIHHFHSTICLSRDLKSDVMSPRS